MSTTFGRRTLPTYRAPARDPAIPAAVQEALLVVKRPQQDPEIVEWTKARAMTRWKIWGMCFLIVLGGPMAFFLPDDIGRIAGFASTTVGIAGMLMRWREKPAASSTPKKRGHHSSDGNSYDSWDDFNDLGSGVGGGDQPDPGRWP